MDSSQPANLKKRIAHDGSVQFIYHEDRQRDARGGIYDLIVCSWCKNQIFLYRRKDLNRCIAGKQGRLLPHCGCKSFDKDAILADYKTEMSIKDIAQKHGCSKATVGNLARIAGLPPKIQVKNGGRVVTSYRIIAEILLTCDTLKTAEKLGTTRKRVRDAINEYMTKITKPPVG